MKLLLILASFVLFQSVSTSLFAQGCSDAGFCTMGGLHLSDNEESNSNRSTLSVGTFFGFADNSIMVSGAIIDYQYSISKDFTAGIRATSLLQTGKQTTQFGLSDVFVNGGWNVDNNFSVIGGIKIPLSSANKTINGRSLPMDYQSSLGTVDAIVGIAFSVDDFQFQIGYQHPLTQNENRFEPFSEVGTTLDFSGFQNTLLYNRSADALFRVSYSLLQNKNWSMIVGVLPIYHLNEDSFFETQNNMLELEKITGSRGFTVNANIFLRYNFSNKSALELTLASPVKARTARPDGLTRAFISSLDYKFFF